MNTTSNTTIYTGDSTARVLNSTDIAFITDGGLETTLVFHQGVELPDFAAFPLLDHHAGRLALSQYYEPYLDIAEASGLGMVLDTPTWRANPNWASRLGYDTDALRAVNREAVCFIRGLAASRPDLEVVLNGAIGPRGDGYVVAETMTPAAAAVYHTVQVEALADARADMVTAVTMTYAEEAIGVAKAAEAANLPAVIGFTVETDGRLPSGQDLGDAVADVDEATGGSPVWYMVNCAHPSHFEHLLRGDQDWVGRIRAVRANASRMSHAELDDATELDRGDIEELAADYLRLRDLLPNLAVIGGCCGTDHDHIAAISATLS